MEERSHSLVLAIGKLRAEEISESIYVSTCRVMPSPVLTKVSHKSDPIREVAGNGLRCTLKIEVVRDIDGGKRNDGPIIGSKANVGITQKGLNRGRIVAAHGGRRRRRGRGPGARR